MKVLVSVAALLALSVIDHAMADTASLSIDWQRANTDFKKDKGDVAEQSKVRSAAKDMSQTQLPVLAIQSGGPKRGSPEFVQQDTSFTLTYPLPDAKLSITGSAEATIAGDQSELGKQLSSAPNKEDKEFETSEEGATLSFQKYGASYTLMITCSIQTDEKCQESKFLNEVADKLMVVGGAAIK